VINLRKFSGLTNENPKTIRIPDQLLRFFLSNSCEPDVIITTLFFLLKVNNSEGAFIYLNHKDFLCDPLLLTTFSKPGENPQQAIEKSLKQAVEYEILLEGFIESENREDRLYFLNSPKGRAAIKAIKSGNWNDKSKIHGIRNAFENEVNVYKAYEENIGPLTPMIADAMKDSEEIYPEIWIYEAIKIATEKNKRNWSYIQAILKRWQAEGKDVRKDRQDIENDRRKYTDGEYSEFIDH
jgi:DNA replication protein